MSVIQVQQSELVSFFGSEPRILGAGIPWPYNEFVWEFTQASTSLYFEIAPAFRDIRMMLMHLNAAVYELHASGIDNLQYHKDGSRESLELVLNARDRLWLTLYPAIAISHETTDG